MSPNTRDSLGLIFPAAEDSPPFAAFRGLVGLGFSGRSTAFNRDRSLFARFALIATAASHRTFPRPFKPSKTTIATVSVDFSCASDGDIRAVFFSRSELFPLNSKT
jgi:hypothetical protein